MRPCDVVLCLHSTTTLPQVPFHSIIRSLKAILESRGSFWSAGMSCPSAARCLSASKLLLNLRMCNLLLLRCWDGSEACSVYVSDLLHLVLEMKCASVLTTETNPLIIDILVQLVVRRRSSDAPNDATKHSMLRNGHHLGWARRRLSLAGLQLCIHGAVLDGDLESAEILAQHAVLTNQSGIANSHMFSTRCAVSGDSRALALAFLWQAWEKHDSCSTSTRCYVSKRYGASTIIEIAETAASDFPKLKVSSIHSPLGLSTALYLTLRYFLAASFAKHKAKMTLADCRQRMVRYALRAMHLAFNTLLMEPMSHTRNVQADAHFLLSNSQWAEHVCGCNMMNMIDACLVVIIASVGSPWCTAHVYATVQRLCILNEEPLLSLYGAICPALQRAFSKEWAHMCQRRLVHAVDTVVTLVAFGWPWTGSHVLLQHMEGLLYQQNSVITDSHHDKAPEFLLPELRMLGWAVVIFMIGCTSGDEGVGIRCRTHTSTFSDIMACRDREAWGEVKLATGVVAPLLTGLQTEGLAHYDRLSRSIARLLAVHLTHVLWGFSRCKTLHCLTTLVGLYINSDIDARCLAKSCLVKEANHVLSYVCASPMTRMIVSILRCGGHKVLDSSPHGGGIVVGSLAPSSLEAIQRADPSEDSRNGHGLFNWKAWYIRDHNAVQPQVSVYIMSSATGKTRESPIMHAVTNASLLSCSVNSTSHRTHSLSLTSCLLPSAYCEMCCQPAWRMLWSWCLVEYRDRRWGAALLLCILHGVAIARSLHSVTSDSDDVDWIVATSSLASSLPSCVACLSPCCFDLGRVSVDAPMQVYREKLHRDACCMILQKVRKISACLFQVPQTRKMYLLALGVLVELNSPKYTGYRGQFNAACAIIQGLELSECDACSTTSTYLHTHELLSALVSSTDCPLESQHAVVKFGVSLIELSKKPKPSMNTGELTKAVSSLWMHLLVRARGACHTSTALGVSYLTIARSLLDAFCGAHECVPWNYGKTTRSTVKKSMLAATTGGALMHTLVAHLRVCQENRGCSTSCIDNDECRRWVTKRHLRQLLLSNRELCGLISKIVQHRKLSMSHNEIVEAFQVSKDVMPSFKEWAWCSVTVARRRTRGRRKLLVFFRSVVSPFWNVAFRNMPVCSLGYTWGLFAANVITCKHFVSLGWCGNAADAKEDIVAQGPTVGLLASRTSFLLQESVVSCFIAFIITFRTARRLLRSRGRKEDLACEVEAPLIHVSSCVIPLECLLQTHNLQIDRPRNTHHGSSVNDAQRFGFLKAIASISLHCAAQVESCTERQGRNCEGDLIMANVLLRGVFRIQHGSNQGDCACPLL